MGGGECLLVSGWVVGGGWWPGGTKGVGCGCEGVGGCSWWVWVQEVVTSVEVLVVDILDVLCGCRGECGVCDGWRGWVWLWV